MRTLTVVLFLTVFSLVLVAGHYYLWRKLVKRTGLPRIVRRFVTAAVVLAAVLVPLGFALSRLLPRDTIGPLVRVTYTWLGFVFYLIVLLALWDVPRLLLRWVGRLAGRGRAKGAAAPAEVTLASEGGEPPPAAPPTAPPAALTVDGAAGAEPPGVERRVFLARAVAGAAFVGAGAVTGLGVSEALGAFRVPEVAVRLERLPAALSGFRIALLTDIHIGPWLGRSFMERVVERVRALKPDLVAVTGDLVDGRVPLLGDDVAPLGRLEAPYGAFFVTGNHEYYSGVEPWLEYVRRLGLRVLMNEHVAVGDRGPGGASFDLAGVPDHSGGRFDAAHAPDYERAVAGRDPARELVLLAHQPVQVDGAARIGAGLQLAGHTHGGQLWPFGVLTGLVQPYIQGLHRHADRTQIYVSAGTGFWGPPMRVLAPPEITLVVLSA